jgi:hypothetical protein
VKAPLYKTKFQITAICILHRIYIRFDLSINPYGQSIPYYSFPQSVTRRRRFLYPHHHSTSTHTPTTTTTTNNNILLQWRLIGFVDYLSLSTKKTNYYYTRDHQTKGMNVCVSFSRLNERERLFWSLRCEESRPLILQRRKAVLVSLVVTDVVVSN